MSDRIAQMYLFIDYFKVKGIYATIYLSISKRLCVFVSYNRPLQNTKKACTMKPEARGRVAKHQHSGSGVILWAVGSSAEDFITNQVSHSNI